MFAAAAGLVAAGALTWIILASQSRGSGHEIVTAAFAWALVGAFGTFHAMPLLALVMSLAVGLAWRRTMTRIESAQAIVLGGCLLLLPLCAMAVGFLSH
jgi:hypothetical protein